MNKIDRKTSVSQFALELKVPVATLLEQLAKAGVSPLSIDDALSAADKAKLLYYLGENNSRVQVTVRSKALLVRRDYQPPFILQQERTDDEIVRQFQKLNAFDLVRSAKSGPARILPTRKEWKAIKATRRADIRALAAPFSWVADYFSQLDTVPSSNRRTLLAAAPSRETPKIPSHGPDQMAQDMTRPNPIAEARAREAEAKIVAQRRSRLKTSK